MPFTPLGMSRKSWRPTAFWVVLKTAWSVPTRSRTLPTKAFLNASLSASSLETENRHGARILRKNRLPYRRTHHVLCSSLEIWITDFVSIHREPNAKSFPDEGLTFEFGTVNLRRHEQYIGMAFFERLLPQSWRLRTSHGQRRGGHQCMTLDGWLCALLLLPRLQDAREHGQQEL